MKKTRTKSTKGEKTMKILSKRSEVLAKTAAKSAQADVKNKAHDLRAAAGNVAEIAKDDLIDFANVAGTKVRGLIENYSEEVANTTENVAEQIRTKPLQSALIALGAGFLIGLLARR